MSNVKTLDEMLASGTVSAPTSTTTTEAATTNDEDKFVLQSFETLPQELTAFLERSANGRELYQQSLQALETILKRASSYVIDTGLSTIANIFGAEKYCDESCVDDDMRFEAIQLYLKYRGIIWQDYNQVFKVEDYSDRGQLSQRMASLVKEARGLDYIFNTMKLLQLDKDHAEEVSLAYVFVFLTVRVLS